MQGLFYGNGGVRGAAAWRLCLTCLTCLTNWGAIVYPVGGCLPLFGLARGRFTAEVIIAIGAPITQSHNSHNSHNSHIKRRPIDFANRNGYTEFECKKLP